MTFKSKNLSVIIFFFALGFFVYNPSVTSEFLNWDDEAYITKNPLFKNLNLVNFSKLFVEYVLGNYHPITMITFFIEYVLFGDNAIPFRIINIIIHCCNSLLIFYILKTFFKNDYLNIIGGVIFLVHPIHVESVAWISERKDLLYSLFFLLSIKSYINYLNSKGIKSYYMSIAYMLLSVLSKGQGVTLSAIIILIDYFYKNSWTRKRVLEKLPFVTISIIFSIIAVKAQQSADAVNVGITEHYSIIQRFLLVSYGFSQYIFKYVIPYNLSAVYPYPFKHIATIPTHYWVFPVIVIGYISLLFVEYYKSHRINLFALLFFIITLFPVLQIFPVGEAVMADRYLYMPLFGLILLSLSILNKFKLEKVMPKFIIISILGGFCYKSYCRSKVWSNRELFWQVQTEQQPNYGKGFNNLGAVFYEQGDTTKALTAFKSAIENDYKLALLSIAVVERDKGNFQNAVDIYNSVISLYPENIRIYKGLMLNHMDLKQYESALTAINKALELSDNSPYYIIKKGDLFFLLKDFQEAIKWYNIAEKKGSQHPTFFYNRAKAYIELGEKQKAINDLSIYLSKTPTKEGFLKRAAIYKSLNNPKGLINDYNNAYSLDTSDINILVNKAQVLFVLKQYKLAEKTFKQIAKKKPSTSIINNIGLCAQKQNKFDEAIQFYSFAIEKEPSFSEAYYNRARTYAELKENILAIDDYSKAIAINSNYTVAYKYRAISLLINGKKTQACKDYKKALQLGLKTKDEQLNKLCVN